MDVTIQGAIELILTFCQFPTGVWKDTPIESPLVTEFIDAGYASLDEKKEKYEPNDSGKAFLWKYIEQISIDFIEFIKNNHFYCFDEDAVLWFANTFVLNSDTADSLYDYISFILERFGYKRNKFHQLGKGYGYTFEEIQ